MRQRYGFRHLGITTIALITAVRAVPAATLTWDSGGATPATPTDGSGTWDTATGEWSNGSSDQIWNNANSDTAVFGNANGAAGTVTLGTAVTAGSITFNAAGSGGYIVGNTSASALTLTTGDVNVTAGVTGTITSPIDGSNGLTVSGGGTLALGGMTNPLGYTGTTTINNSALQFNNLSPSAAVTLGNGTSTVSLEGAIATLTSDITQSKQFFLNANVVIANDTDATINFSPRTYIGEGSAGGNTSVTGGAASTLNLIAGPIVSSGGVNSPRDLFYDSAGGFDGTLNVQPGSAGDPIIFEGVSGAFSSSATGDFAGTPGTFNINAEISIASPSAGETYTLGALGGASTGIIDTPISGGTATWSVGGLGLSTTYAGAINGNNALTLTGGSLALTGTSTYTGGTTLSGGLLNFSSLSNLGSGAITFGGGTLQYATGNTVDISAVTVTLGTGGGTIDTNGNNVTLANSIGNGGAGGLTKVGGGTLTLSGVNNYTGGTAVNGGTLVIAPTTTANAVALPDGAVSIGAAGTLQLADNAGASTPNDVTNQLLQISSLSIASGGVLDIRNNHFYVADPGGNADDSTYTSILGWVKNGANSTPGGVINSTEGLPGYGVGVVDGNDNVLGTLVSANQIEVAYTLEGDANLDGKVDITDFNIFAPNFGLPTTLGWEAGDFNYSGTVDIGDFNLFAGNFGLSDNGTAISLPAADIAALDSFAAANGLTLPATSVPEPVSMGGLVVAGVAILGRRARRKSPPKPPA